MFTSNERKKIAELREQGAYNSGKPGNLREFVNSGKLRENSGNLKFTQKIYMILSLGHQVVCIIVSNSSVNWLVTQRLAWMETVTMLLQ